MPPVRGRLAPSPTGALHLGNARSFLIAWLSIRSRGGSLVLRMEDLDHPKVNPARAADVLRDLRWLGLDWDEGPDIGGPRAPYTQSQRLGGYAVALERLRAEKRVYPCVCRRRDVTAGQSAPHAEDATPRYPGTCRNRFSDYDDACRQRLAALGSVSDDSSSAPSLNANQRPAWRFIARGATSFTDGFHGPQHANLAQEEGDFVIARHPQGAGYMLAVVVDDAAMGITEVLRGDDLLPATHRQLQLYRALELPPPAFIHVPLVVNEKGRRLAKRHGDTRIATLRANGIPATKVTGLLAWWCGWAHWGEPMMPRDLLPRFNLESLPRRPVVLDQRIRDYLDIA